MMDIEAHLLKGFSKDLSQELADYISLSQKQFDDFMPFFINSDKRTCQRSAWALGIACDKKPDLIIKWMPEILRVLEKPLHDAVVRNTVRTIEKMDPIPEAFEGEIFDRCFNYLNDLSCAIAIRAFSMTICRKIALKYPDLIPELIAVIEEHIDHGSKGFKSRGGKELNILRKGMEEVNL